MDDYREYVTAVAALADGKETILNKTTAHASVLIATLFRKAQRTVRIVSGGLDGRVYGTDEVIAAAEGFLALPGTQLEIVIEREVSFSSNRFLAALRNSNMLPSDRVTLRRSEIPVPFHFLLADESHYRFRSRYS